MNQQLYAERIRKVEANPELLYLSNNNPVVHHAVRLWAMGFLEKADAYEEAMVILAKHNAKLTEQLARCMTQSTVIPIVPP